MQHRVWKTAYALFDLKNAVITIQDGTTPANSITVKIGEGTVGWTEKKERRYILDRGLLDSVRNEDEVPLDVNLNFMWEYLEGGLDSGDDPSVMEALKQAGNASAWVSTDADTCQPYAVDIIITYTPTPASCGDIETITLPDFRYENGDFDIRNPEAVAITGRCNVTEPVIVREGQS